MFLATVAWAQDTPVDKNVAFDTNNVLIDVRSQQEYEAGHLKNAKNIPVDKIAEDIKCFVPDKEKTIVVYCRSGKRAGRRETTTVFIRHNLSAL